MRRIPAGILRVVVRYRCGNANRRPPVWLILLRNRAKILHHPFGEIEAHGLCIGYPEATHPVSPAGCPFYPGYGTQRVKQVLVGDRDAALLFALGFGKLKCLRLIALAHPNRKHLRVRIQHAKHMRRVSQFFQHLFL